MATHLVKLPIFLFGHVTSTWPDLNIHFLVFRGGEINRFWASKTFYRNENEKDISQTWVKVHRWSILITIAILKQAFLMLITAVITMITWIKLVNTGKVAIQKRVALMFSTTVAIVKKNCEIGKKDVLSSQAFLGNVLC